LRFTSFDPALDQVALETLDQKTKLAHTGQISNLKYQMANDK